MLIELNLVKKYLRLEEDYTEEDDLLSLMINNAEAYIQNAVDILDCENEKMMNQMRLLALVLVTDFYENRELTGKASDKVRHTVQSLITQIQYSYRSDEK